jgi:putative acetyltransferase
MLKPATSEDLNFIFELYMHPQVNRYLLYEQMDIDSFQPIFNELMQRKVLFIYEKENTSIGMCKLVQQQHRNSHIVYLGGVAIHPSYAGKGEGLTMLNEIIDYVQEKGLLRIELSVASINGKAIRLYEKAGFVKEGILKKFTYLKSEDKYLDEVMMAYLF